MDIQKLLRASKSSTSSEEGGGVRDKGYKRRSLAIESTGKAKALRVIKVGPCLACPATALPHPAFMSPWHYLEHVSILFFLHSPYLTKNM